MTIFCQNRVFTFEASGYYIIGISNPIEKENRTRTVNCKAEVVAKRTRSENECKQKVAWNDLS